MPHAEFITLLFIKNIWGQSIRDASVYEENGCCCVLGNFMVENGRPPVISVAPAYIINTTLNLEEVLDHGDLGSKSNIPLSRIASKTRRTKDEQNVSYVSRLERIDRQSIFGLCGLGTVDNVRISMIRKRIAWSNS